MNKYYPELLAPARDLESGIQAINAGADAVYMGASKFGARSAVGNSLKDIEKLCKYAHIFYCKVYVTINTVLFENELSEAEKLIHSLYNIGVDAIIFQDMALLEMNLPPIALFASTQVHNYDVERITFLENKGIQRFILARETSLEQIKTIKSKTKAELEYFIHGSLCVSFSGRCFFSKAVTGKSGNRGECSQPCRRYFDLETSDGKTIMKNKHVLSLKDLNLSNHIKPLYQSGISSFKIEGRLKDVIYVKNIVAYYRQLIDASFNGTPGMKKRSSGNFQYNFTPNPEKTFNRGYTTYFVDKKRKENTSPSTPKSTGQYLGKVSIISGNIMVFDKSVSLHAGDGICFYDKEGKLTGTRIEKVDGKNIYISEGKELFLGCDIFRNFDAQFAKAVEHEKSCVRKIPVSLALKEIKNGIALTAIDNEGNVSEIKHETSLIKAENPDGNFQLKKQITKMGNTPFEATSVSIQTENEYFFRISEINELRRKCIEKLQLVREVNRPKLQSQSHAKNMPFPTNSIFDDENVINSLSERFYRKLGIEQIPQQLEISNSFIGKTIATTKFCIRYEHNICPGKNAEPLILKDNLHKYKLEFDCTSCEMKVILLEKKNKPKSFS